MAQKAQAILVTGATGFLGRRLCQRLQLESEKVVAMGRQQVEGPWDRFVELDLSQDVIDPALLEGVRIIYHLASKAHTLAEMVKEKNSYRPIIVDGTQRLLESAKLAGVERFIHISSVKAMGEGNPSGIPLSAINENWPHTPQSSYGLAKAEAEALVLNSGIPHAVVLRPTMVFGPGEKGNLTRMIEAVRRGRFPPIPETGNRRSMIHVDDVVDYMLKATTLPIAAGKTYILSAPEALSTRELYDVIRQSLGLTHQNWSIPLNLLSMATTMGSVAGTILGKRMPLDRETLQKLTGSAWYSPLKAQTELKFTARHSVREWLLS